MKKLVEWAEGEVSRGRKIVLFSVIFFFILITLLAFIIFTLGYGDRIKDFFPYYTTFGVLAGTAVGFYTGTSPKSTNLNKGELNYQSKDD